MFFMSEKDVMIKDLVEEFKKGVEDPDQFDLRWNNGIKHGSDNDGFYFVLRNEKYRCLNHEIKTNFKLTPEIRFDSRTDILICQDEFVVNNDPRKKYVVIV